jgi:hypothetical protein
MHVHCVTDRLHPDQAVTEHERVDTVLDPGRRGVSSPLQEEHVVMVDLCLQLPRRIRHIPEQLSERRPDPVLASPDACGRDEPAWSNLKRSLANLTKQDIGQLTALVKTRLRRMQYRPGLLDGFLAKTGLDLGNFHN